MRSLRILGRTHRLLKMSRKIENLKIIGNLLPLKEMHSPRRAYLSLSSEQKKHIDKFNEDIFQGRIKFEQVPCLCSNNEFFLLASVDKYSLSQQTVMCAKCGLVQSNPRMTEEQYKVFYNSDIYRNIYRPNDPLKKYDLCGSSGSKAIFEAICKIKKLEEINSVLEIGAGGGWNLMPFKKEGITTMGCDYSPSLVSLGKKNGLNLFQGGIDEIDGSFDLIILNHVVEHFNNPVDDLKKIKKHLNPNGIIYISVPNIENFGMAQIQNAHTYYFTPLTLRYFMSISGLRPIYHCSVRKTQCFTAVFINDEEALADDLNENYKHMLNIIKRYRYCSFMVFMAERIKKTIIKLLELIGLKRFILKLLIKDK